jgi:hypothetical protein
MPRRFVVTLFALFLIVGTRALAQGTAPATRANVLSINPLGIPFEVLSAEFERAATGNVSVGASVGYTSISDEVDYLSLDAKARYYPNGPAPRGFSVGISAGYTRITDEHVGFDGNEESYSAPSLGVLVDYNWLLGASKRFFVGAGLGAKRVFGSEDDDDLLDDDVSFAYPTARFQVGFTF